MRIIKNIAAFIIWLCIGGLLVIASARAENPHHDHAYLPIEPYTYTTTSTTTEKTGCDGSALGVAAAQHQFDFGTHSWQWAAGAAYVDKNGEGCEALSFGLGKRIDRAVINGSISHESDSTAYGIGINGRF